jgi:transcriptional regulator with XRE-family HTH domain
MRFPTKTTAIVVAGAAGLASVAYGIGTQTGGGASEAAATGGAANQRGFAPPGLNQLAKRLGVDADALAKALRDFHQREHQDMRASFAKALADALGKSADDVQSALDLLESQREARFAGELARALGVDADAVQKALDELQDEGPSDHGDFAAALAQKLNVDANDVEAALMKLHPRERGERHRDATALRRLAAALDVTPADLRRALSELRRNAELEPPRHRDELVKFLADRFNLSEDKVDQALPSFPRSHAYGPHGRDDHDGPGGRFRGGGPGPFMPPPGDGPPPMP